MCAHIHRNEPRDKEYRRDEERRARDRAVIEIRLRIGEDHAEHVEDRRRCAEFQRERARPREQVGIRQAEREERRAVEREHAEEGHAADDGIGREEVKEPALIDHIRADGESRNEVRDGNAPQERGNHTADRQRARPSAFPFVVVAVMTELERHAA